MVWFFVVGFVSSVSSRAGEKFLAATGCAGKSRLLCNGNVILLGSGAPGGRERGVLRGPPAPSSSAQGALLPPTSCASHLAASPCLARVYRSAEKLGDSRSPLRPGGACRRSKRRPVSQQTGSCLCGVGGRPADSYNFLRSYCGEPDRFSFLRPHKGNKVPF